MKKRSFKALLWLLLGLLPLSACAQSPSPSDGEEGAGVYRKITAEEAQKMMEDPGSFILLDVRTPSEFEEKRIEGALLLPDTEIKEKAEEILPDKEAVILVYCRSGRRSAQSAKELNQMGYTNVYDFGGIIDWPYDTVSGK